MHFNAFLALEQEPKGAHQLCHTWAARLVAEESSSKLPSD